ncbi:MAG: hypothetical protein WCL46_00880 [Chlorobium sp.]
MSKVQFPLDIFVSDVSAESLAQAEARWNEVVSSNTSHKVDYVVGLLGLPDNIDIAIIATLADVREKIVMQLSNQVKVRYWILEKLLAQNVDDLLSIKDVISQNGMAWVNTPMHIWSLYRNIRSHYDDKPGSVDATFDKVNRLACNAIHYIDYISRWNKALPVSVDTSNLFHQWEPTKREGFYDVYGELIIDFSDGSKLKIIGNNDDPNKRVNIIKVNKEELHVSESQGIATALDGITITGRCEFQSELTAPLVESILQIQSCDLPTFTESVIQHRMLLESLLKHWNTYMPNKLERLPIT